MVDEIREIIAKVMRVPLDKVTAAASPDTISTWDSLSHLQLVAALENRFSCRLNLREIQSMDTLDKIIAILTTRVPVA